jgi:ketosteroid isomerase-like protein
MLVFLLLISETPISYPKLEDSMKKLYLIVVVLLAITCLAFAQGVEQALLDLEHQWAKASKASDGIAIAPLLADDLAVIDSDGSMLTKSDYVERTKKAKWQTNEISDLKVRVYGNSAVVTGMWTGKGTDGSGKPYDGKERWADTWVKMPSGKWQCVASASATVK